MVEHDLGTPTPRGGQFRIVGAFRPHILIFLAMLFALTYPVRGIVAAGVHLWWGSTYRAVDFVMDEANPNRGSPYIAGHLDGATEQTNLPGAMHGETMVVDGVPSEAFAPGKRVKIWHSDDAPNIEVFGTSLNNLPVAALPQRPGMVSLLLYLALLWIVLIVGLRSTAWVANRFSGVYNRTVTLPG